MPIKRYYATADTTIVNSFKSDLVTRSIDSNAGQSDIIEMYCIHGRVSTESLEKSRILVRFNIDELVANPLPSGTKYYLKLFNAEHGESLPSEFSISVKPILEEWEEGSGLDLIRYGDVGHASWVGRKAARVAQVSTIELNSVNPLHYADQYISLFDAVGDQYNFFFKVVAEASSNLPVGTDVEVDLTDLGGDTISDKLTEVILGHPQFSAVQNAQGVIEVTNSTPGTAKDPTISLFDDPATAPLILVSTQGSDYTAWSTSGGHYGAILDNQQQEVVFEQFLELGTEDVEIEITPIVEEWLSADPGTLDNNGLGIMLKAEFEDGSRSKSYYTKRFFARRSEYFLKRPAIEARYSTFIQDDSTKLKTANPHHSSSANTNRVYYKNYENGVLTDLSESPKFTLTTDKALTDKVTLQPDRQQNVIIASPGSDYTENAYVEIEVANTAAHDDHNFANSLIRISHTDPGTGQENIFDFVGRYHNWNAPSERVDIFPINVSNTSSNRVAAAQAIADELNAAPGFTALFAAEAAGEKIRVYSRLTGLAGQSSSLSIHGVSTSQADFIQFTASPDHGAFDPFVQDADPNQEGDQPGGNVYDSVENQNDAQYEAYRQASAITVLLPDLSVVLAGDTTYNKRTRFFRGNSGIAADEITSEPVSGLTGVYVAEFKIANNISVSTLYKKWWIGDNTPNNIILGHSGNSPVKVQNWYDVPYSEYEQSSCRIVMNNLQESYSKEDLVSFKFSVRDPSANLNVRTVNGTTKPAGKVISEIYYRLYRVSDNFEIISYNENKGTNHNRISFDGLSNCFDLDMSILEEGYTYAIDFLVVNGSNKKQVDQSFRFKIR